MVKGPDDEWLKCPSCGARAFKAWQRGRWDADGNFIEHAGGCRCRWCEWQWFEDEPLAQCACGVTLRVSVDDHTAYAVVVER